MRQKREVDSKLLMRISVRIPALVLTSLLVLVSCSSEEIPNELQSMNSSLAAHNGYWVMKLKRPGNPLPVTVVNDMYMDLESRRSTVYAQSRVLGQITSPPQVGPGECTQSIKGDPICFHPNAVYLNGSGQELESADGEGSWWVKHSWVVDGEGYYNCELKPQENYKDCFRAEGRSLPDGVSMKIGGTRNGYPLYNIRTPVLTADPVSYTVTRYGPANLDPTEGKIDVTPEVKYVLDFACRNEVSALSGMKRVCP